MNQPILKSDALYIGDNGRAFCGEHAGTAALYTGRDLSGQPVMKVTEQDQKHAERTAGFRVRCEECS